MLDEPLINRLEAGATLVVATRRLGRALEADYARRQQSLGRTAWGTPAIFSYEAWLNRLWSEAEDFGIARERLLDELFESTLWERYIESDRQLPGLFDRKFAAAQAQEAYGLLRRQGLALRDLPTLLSADCNAFRRWASQFERECHARQLLSQAEMEWRLGEWIRAGHLALAGPILFAGFDLFSPAQSQLHAAMDTVGTGWESVSLGVASPAEAQIHAAGDPNAELVAAAQWARHLCEKDPAARIGVVVLDLDKRLRVVERVFRDVFVPGLVWQRAGFGERVNISLGRCLVDEPPVKEALWLLEQCLGETSWTRASALLRSAHFYDGEASRPRRALRDVLLRAHTGTTVDLAALTSFERAYPADERDGGDLTWATIDEAVRNWPARATPSRWRELIDQFLSACGWMQGSALDDAAQIRQWWRNAADRLSGLDGWLRQIGASEAVGRLKQLLQEQLVQEETPFAPVQVMGALEAGGLTFDAVWIAGARDDILPAPVAPNPFLPAHWQRKEGFPRAEPARENELARRRVAGFLGMAPAVIFSFSQKDGDQHFGPSPLLRGLPELPAAVLEVSVQSSWCARLFASASLDAYEDVRGRPLRVDGLVRGGAGIIKAQSVCPFQGFARAQLDAEPLPEPVDGLDAAERGKLVHDVLHHIWLDLRTQAELCSIEPERLHGKLEAAASQAVEDMRRKAKRPFPKRMLELERLRLIGLVKRWLEFERERPPFSTEVLEWKRRIGVGPLELETRIDRIDRLPGGERLIIDYKTGFAQIKDWFGTRPDEPQLPLYAVTDEQPVDGLIFARVRPGDFRLFGLSAVSDCGEDVVRYVGSKFHHGDMTWSDQLAEWRGRLEALATELMEGVAAVAPKHGIKTCEQCRRMSLCRVYEVTAALASEEEEGDDGIGAA